MADEELPEERLAALLALLPPAPEAWVEAAKQLPAARAQIETIVARAEEDAGYRARLVADLEAALVADGIEPTAALQRELTRRLSAAARCATREASAAAADAAPSCQSLSLTTRFERTSSAAEVAAAAASCAMPT